MRFFWQKERPAVVASPPPPEAEPKEPLSGAALRGMLAENVRTHEEQKATEQESRQRQEQERREIDVARSTAYAKEKLVEIQRTVVEELKNAVAERKDKVSMTLLHTLYVESMWDEVFARLANTEEYKAFSTFCDRYGYTFQFVAYGRRSTPGTGAIGSARTSPGGVKIEISI